MLEQWTCWLTLSLTAKEYNLLFPYLLQNVGFCNSLIHPASPASTFLVYHVSCELPRIFRNDDTQPARHDCHACCPQQAKEARNPARSTGADWARLEVGKSRPGPKGGVPPGAHKGARRAPPPPRPPRGLVFCIEIKDFSIIFGVTPNIVYTTWFLHLLEV